MKDDKGKKEKRAPVLQAPASDSTHGGVLQNHTGVPQVTQELIRLFATKATKKAYLDAVAELIRSWSGCGSVGVRVLDRDGRIPYESTLGFSAGFCATEGPISLRTDRCACTRVIEGSPLAPDLPYMTKRGSFHCNDTDRFLGSLSEAEKGDYRGVCISSGYASVAVVPIRYRDRIIGAIHVADTGKAHVPLEVVEFLEAASAVVGEAIYRLNLEEDLRKSEENYRSIFENAIEGIFQIEPDGRFLSLNPALVRMLGYGSIEEVLGEPEARLRFIDPEREREFHQRLEAEGFVQGFETELGRSRGKPAWVSVNGRAVRDSEGTVSRYEGMVQDITQRKESEAELIRLAATVEQDLQGVVITDRQGSILYVNEAFTQLRGCAKEGLVGQAVSLLRIEREDEPLYEKLWNSVRRGAFWAGRLVNPVKGATTYQADVRITPIRDESGNIVNYVAVERDMTHEVGLERQLRQAQKMEAIGTLAGGIAHDFNNILGAIIGFTEMALDQAEEGSTAHKRLGKVLKAGMRGRELVKRIMSFSRPSEQITRPTDVCAMVEEVLGLLRPSLPSRVFAEFQTGGDALTVMADPSQLQQVVMNLCTNAVHAMREGGGVLAVEARPFRADDGAAILGIGSGDYVEISVRDSGVGMDSRLLERIFDPFFTTREHGEGAGLGLSVVHGIVRSHNGAITVESAPGKGSTFRVYLPRSFADGDARERSGDEVKGGGERILLVDDDEALLEIGRDMIEELGYTVDAVGRGEEALALFKAEPESYDLVITDHTMADMTGAELSQVVRDVRCVPVLLLTGFNESSDAADLKIRGITRVVTKPLTRAELAEAIRQALKGER